MPLIEVTAFDRRFDDDEEAARLLIERLTEAFVKTYGTEIRDETWVILHGVPPRNWGFGGHVRT
jgi:phenylpyruvate tautomerase PptA (4-oxalocrotonate tautomerase family)